MLKALEIAGFKSFADRTRFEFPPGITVVVGPNGSGKSNIVDAIKWVLGEQSAKSLRGHEMADVIFNGSGTRRALNAAEITVTFDNSKHLLAIDAPEVAITRRVYRGGEGEYLINRNPARLRDIRDLLSGTGMGTQAYSVIEQGKVDVLLQSSPRDRRAIFEEAAGISRFKLRKLEALRRLERVEQNVLRLSDIVDEVEGRLRSVRAQAGKARRYKEHTNRLQELRTQVGQVDWKRLTERLTVFDDELESLDQERNATATEAEGQGTQLTDVEHRVDEVSEQIRQSELRIATHRERIAAAESTAQHERNRVTDLEQEIARYQRQLATMNARAGDLQQQLRDTTAALEAAEQNHREVAVRLVEAERGLTDTIESLDRLRGENQQHRTAHDDAMRQAAALLGEIRSLESQSAAAESVRQHSGERLAELDVAIDVLQRQLTDLRQRRDEASARAQQQAERLAADRDQLAQYRRQHAAGQNTLADLGRRHAGAVERAAVLEELVRRHDGLSAGVKEVLSRSANTGDGVFRNVFGLVADLFQVGVETAPLVEIALGQVSQHLVAARSGELMSYLQAESHRLGGRVGFVWLDEGTKDSELHPSPLSPLPSPLLEGRPGVLGRADRFVKTDARFAPLVERLLGRTWFVEKLSHALLLARSVGPGLCYVTLAGELLDPDGTLTVGPRNITTGQISRRSQLRALEAQIVELKTAIEAASANQAELDERIEAHAQLVDRREAEHRQTSDALSDSRLAVAASEERRSQLDQQRASLLEELNEAQARFNAAQAPLADARRKQTHIETALAETEAALRRLGEEIQTLEGRRQATDRETTEIKVELAKSDERLRNLHARTRQFEESREERDRALEEIHLRLSEASERSQQSRQNILQAESEIATLYLDKETSAALTVELVNQREALHERRGALTAEIQKLQGRLHKLEEKMHAVELSANEVRHERGALADRLREDYGIELADLEHHPTDEEQRQRDEVQQEIEELRQKIANLGNVNLEALDELEQLESRHKTLFDQYNDLTSAKSSLEKIIDKINADSRRLFSETLETVRGHFQTLFRDLFGGGRADIVLEEDVDLLDSGIEIVARPPGKEPRSISLLSGGEKTMTCVALLLAIFRSRPSPFCVLDEVDAALDEANIDRFTQVLKDFLAWTQFIIVTHSKKTMTCADTIYGVTMQESGVTKQVSVRFEDVSDDGRILSDRADDEETQAA